MREACRVSFSVQHITEQQFKRDKWTIIYKVKSLIGSNYVPLGNVRRHVPGVKEVSR